MKIIAGSAGQGRTRHIAELVSEVMKEGHALVITGDLSPQQYVNYLYEKYKVDVNYSSIVGFNDMIEGARELHKKILTITNQSHNAIFIDVPVRYSMADLQLLKSLEEYFNIPIIVSVQTNRSKEVKGIQEIEYTPGMADIHRA